MFLEGQGLPRQGWQPPGAGSEHRFCPQARPRPHQSPSGLNSGSPAWSSGPPTWETWMRSLPPGAALRTEWSHSEQALSIVRSNRRLLLFLEGVIV